MTPKFFKLVSSTGLIPNVLGAELRVALPACSAERVNDFETPAGCI